MTQIVFDRTKAVPPLPRYGKHHLDEALIKAIVAHYADQGFHTFTAADIFESLKAQGVPFPGVHDERGARSVKIAISRLLKRLGYQGQKTAGGPTVYAPTQNDGAL